VRAFKFWLWYAGKQKQQKLTLTRAQSKHQRRLTQGAFSCWTEYVQQRQLKKQLGDKQSIQVWDFSERSHMCDKLQEYLG
jgi:hypothetical protein